MNINVGWQHCVIVLMSEKLKQSALLKLFIEGLLNIQFVLFYRQTVQCEISTSDSNRMSSVSYSNLRVLREFVTFLCIAA